MSNDKPKVPDENDRLRAGKLSPDAFEGTAPPAPLRALEPPKKIGEPSDVHAEGALLGALLWAASNQPDVLRASAVQDILPSGEAFYDRAHGDIFDGVLALPMDELFDPFGDILDGLPVESLGAFLDGMSAESPACRPACSRPA